MIKGSETSLATQAAAKPIQCNDNEVLENGVCVSKSDTSVPIPAAAATEVFGPDAAAFAASTNYMSGNANE